MAINLLTIPATSVRSEEEFSSAGEIVNLKRNRLGDKSIQALIYYTLQRSNICSERTRIFREEVTGDSERGKDEKKKEK